jgi:hypothetical protein
MNGNLMKIGQNINNSRYNTTHKTNSDCEQGEKQELGALNDLYPALMHIMLF